MTEQTQNLHDTSKEEPLKVEKLANGSIIVEILYGIAIMLGLAFLWALETVRNTFFRLLDKANIRPRSRRASAFPPGPVREHTTIEARR